MKKLLFFAYTLFVCIFLCQTSFSQVKTKKEALKTEQKSDNQLNMTRRVSNPDKSGKSVDENKQIARPDHPGKNLGKDGQVAKPEGMLATPKTYRGSASIVFFYFGDSKWETFFQELMELHKAMENYKKVILLKEESYDGIKLSQQALNMADEVAMPTRENIVKYFKELTQEGYYIDVWIFSHGWKSYFRIYDSAENEHNGKFTDDEIRKLPENAGFKYIPIRMVYQCNCYGYDLIDDWRAVGAKTALGARQVNFYPYEFGYFANNWNQGKTFKDARDRANEITPHDPVYLYVSAIMAPNAKNNGEWSGCPTGFNVLGTTDQALDCSRDFFTVPAIWGESLEWRDNGKSTMDYSSFKIVAGDYNIKKNTIPKW